MSLPLSFRLLSKEEEEEPLYNTSEIDFIYFICNDIPVAHSLPILPPTLGHKLTREEDKEWTLVVEFWPQLNSNKINYFSIGLDYH